MNKRILPVVMGAMLGFSAMASHDHDHDGDVRFIDRSYRPYQAHVQSELRSTAAWQNFLNTYGEWYVLYNEHNSLPHNAFGKPIVQFQGNIERAAKNFLAQIESTFEKDFGDLAVTGVTEGDNYDQVHFKQSFQGKELLFSNIFVKFTKDGRIVQYGLDAHHDIDVSTTPSIAEAQAKTAAYQGLSGGVEAAEVLGMAILPIPTARDYEYHLVYEVNVETGTINGVPGVFQVYVDAHDGAVLYRRNKVCSAIDVSASSTIQNDSPDLSSPAIQVMPNMEIEVNGNFYHTDSVGNLTLPHTSSVTATVRLEGKYSRVINGGSTPTFNTTLTPGVQNNISFDNNSALQERSAYYHVNIVHDTMKALHPNFTGLDWQLPTNVDLGGGTCNAFWNGSSINFYAEGGGCYSMAMIRDVVYHEYGHGINDLFYTGAGQTGGMGNGAMHEGYADVWAYIITNSPILAQGYTIGDTNSYIRRYDIDKKVYPEDLVGQVHADGEIIAGAWYDLATVYFQDWTEMSRLWAATYDDLVDGANGTEGTIYTDVLVAALMEDDVPANGGDQDLTNGTPRDLDIVNAFADHGITLLSNATLTHTPVEASAQNLAIDIDAQLFLSYSWALQDASVFYRVNNGNFTKLPLNKISGANYQATIPAQPVGTVVGYYLALEDNYGNVSGVTPFLADDVDPNLPYFILVGVAPMRVEDFDGNGGIWTYGAADDNATTGNWEENIPIGTADGNGGYVQPNDQHTDGGIACAFTENGTPGGAIGEADVDAGKTTMFTPIWDVSGYVDPIMTYYRWYTNNPPTGANPNADWFQVAISNDGGNTWVDVEDTKTSDRSWRRNAFRISDYVSPSDQVQMRFVASDSLRAGQNLNGGSLVEAAVDDVVIYETRNVSVEEEFAQFIQVYPNPAVGNLHIDLSTEHATRLEIEMYSMQGQLVKQFNFNRKAGFAKHQIDVSNLAAGLYQLKLSMNGKQYVQSVSVQ